MCKFSDYESYDKDVGPCIQEIHDRIIHEDHERESLERRLTNLPSQISESLEKMSDTQGVGDD
jgi:hypothetical protein